MFWMPLKGKWFYDMYHQYHHLKQNIKIELNHKLVDLNQRPQGHQI